MPRWGGDREGERFSKKNRGLKVIGAGAGRGELSMLARIRTGLDWPPAGKKRGTFGSFPDRFGRPPAGQAKKKTSLAQTGPGILSGSGFDIAPRSNQFRQHLDKKNRRCT